MFWIVWIVVVCGHGAYFVESLYEHSFSVEVDESHRSLHGVHSACLSPFCHCVEQFRADIIVVDEVYPSESHVECVPRLVCAVVDDGSDSSDCFPVSFSSEELEVAELECGVFLWREGRFQVDVEFWYGVWVAFVEVVVELYETVEVFVCLYLFYNNV